MLAGLAGMGLLLKERICVPKVTMLKCERGSRSCSACAISCLQIVSLSRPTYSRESALAALGSGTNSVSIDCDVSSTNPTRLLKISTPNAGGGAADVECGSLGSGPFG